MKRRDDSGVLMSSFVLCFVLPSNSCTQLPDKRHRQGRRYR